ncbi:hypothetical protein SLEP1_g2710 [Rubroshorea leprosula]|uniref:Uncharacterized protein n=1 Tax=Rubroshorea leprosula TaxID=152421 RepID=A0AAV5HRR0_9ROSI|nr:hypothetical protein SLEP1_g2710 [Rubroshorea leprosula]
MDPSFRCRFARRALMTAATAALPRPGFELSKTDSTRTMPRGRS